MDECDKRGNSCPSRLKCITRDNITHDCGCEKADNVVKGEGKKRFCKGKIMFIFSGPGCWKCGYCNPLDKYYPKDNAIGFRNTCPLDSVTQLLNNRGLNRLYGPVIYTFQSVQPVFKTKTRSKPFSVCRTLLCKHRLL